MKSLVHEETSVKLCIYIQYTQPICGTRIIWHGSKKVTVRRFTTIIEEKK